MLFVRTLSLGDPLDSRGHATTLLSLATLGARKKITNRNLTPAISSAHLYAKRLHHLYCLEGTGGRLQPVLMRHTPQLSVKTRGGGGGRSWGGGSSRGLGGGLPGVGGGSSRGSGGV